LLKKEGICSHSVRQLHDVYTGCGFVTLLDTGENSIVIDPGANLKLSSQMISEDETIIKNTEIVMAQLEIPDETVKKVLKLGKKYKRKTILNPAPARLLPQEVLQYVDILTPNETEAKILLGHQPDAKKTIEELAFGLLEFGIETVIITRGKQGVLIADSLGINKISAPRISPVDSTGAGDCFNGNLAYGLSKGWSVKKAVMRAVYAGAYCTGYLGVIKGLPTKNELDQYITKYIE
ncbi:MAG: PfkB family carbohydrate kinase, partial [Candidatus Paceibacterota bacterium]